MKAAVLREAGKPMTIENVQLDKPGPHEVLIRTAAAGLCHSDLSFVDGVYPTQMPIVLGHESAGIVEAVGSEVQTVKPGDHVVTCITAYCGHCNYCLGGRMSLCVSEDTVRSANEPSRISQNGNDLPQFLKLSSFAEQILTHEHAVVAIRRDMPLDRAAVIGCAVMTGFGAAVNTAGIRPGDTVAVIGCGGVGLPAINGAKIAGAGRIIAIDMSRGKEALARDFGATDFICAADGDPVEAVLELTGGGVRHALECVGRGATMSQSIMMVEPGGTATVVGAAPPSDMVNFPAFALLRERRLQGSYLGSNRFPIQIPQIIDLYMQGRLELDKMVTMRLALEEINKGFDAMRDGQVARAVIEFDH
ncbi:Zn-dependent alcohol dehydrogenase [Novosphingobium pentaromativorans]|nr:Zn-dependent alcohol dehydrogenase [Novosphingobium pentaromativorans]AIT79841.1 alcohol dehydrogenase [Novosphingobium pentaromativorans US6-1]